MSSRHLQVTRHEDVLVVRFLDRKLVGDLPNQLGEELFGVTDQEDCTKLLLSFSGVDFLGSDMLDKVVQVNKRMKRKGGRLTLCEICPYLRQVFVVTKLDIIISIKDTECEGLRASA
jgi:anti-anti-sigma factor